MLVDVPRQWLMLDTGRMAVWFEDYPRRPDPSVVQLVWSDVDGRFPDDPLCDPLVTCSQPMLRDDPRRHPRPPDLRSRHRSRRPGRR
jgi:hypothetical protein